MRWGILLLLLGLSAAPAFAVPVQNNEPTQSEATLLQKLNETAMPPGTQSGFVHIQDPKAAVLVQPAGRLFQDWMVTWRRWFEAAMVVIAVASMAALYFFAGAMTYEADPHGRTMQRFNQFERLVHWMTAFTFVVLALTGLNLVFGRVLLQPLIGDSAFFHLTWIGKQAHNFFGFSFIAGLIVMSLQWLRENLPRRADVTWFKMMGGLFGGPHPAAWKFNAGQKIIYWFAVFGGGLICVTGLALIFPFSFTGVNGMQIIDVVHSAMAAVMIAIIIGHVYLGSVGVKGSFEAMSRGRVDVNWAATHHPLWVEQEIAKGNAPPDALSAAHPAE